MTMATAVIDRFSGLATWLWEYEWMEALKGVFSQSMSK